MDLEERAKAMFPGICGAENKVDEKHSHIYVRVSLISSPSSQKKTVAYAPAAQE